MYAFGRDTITLSTFFAFCLLHHQHRFRDMGQDVLVNQHKVGSHVVSEPDASSPARSSYQEDRCGHGKTTYSLTSHSVASDIRVFTPDASSPASFVVPTGQVVQTWETTCSLAEHKVASHSVFTPDASSPAAFVVPGGQVVQTLETTCSLAEHKVGSHVVFEPMHHHLRHSSYQEDRSCRHGKRRAH